MTLSQTELKTVSALENDYAELRAVSDNYRKYDYLKSNIPEQTQQRRLSLTIRITFMVVLFFTCVASCGITYIIVKYTGKTNVVNNVDRLVSCDAMDCGMGKCLYNSTGQAVCDCPDNFYGDNCEIHRLRISEVPNNCPDGWYSFNLSCYREYVDGKTWFQARDFCRSLGADLASIHREEENKFINDLASSMFYWIGLNRQENNLKFSWSDSLGVHFTKWRVDEPNNYNNNEYCVQMFKFFNGTWNDNNCFMSLSFICKMYTMPLCGPGSWLYFQGSCYMFNRTSLINWHGARQTCLNLGADLAVIHSQSEYNFILSQVTKPGSNDAWIGLSDRESQGNYRWVDRSEPTFLTWNIGEPDNTNHRCVKILTSYGNWDDGGCEDRYGFVCEKNLD